MCMDYSKLWKLLAEKGLSKSDLMELTGLSSRVIGKLVKNETVTTDTLSKICAALSCDVGSIMECVDENTLSLYRYCRAYGKQTEENERVKKIGFVFGNRNYTVYFSKRAAFSGLANASSAEGVSGALGSPRRAASSIHSAS